MSLLPLARGRRWPTGRMRGFFAASDAFKSLTALSPHTSPLLRIKGEGTNTVLKSYAFNSELGLLNPEN
jgi:hypothetical protein